MKNSVQHIALAEQEQELLGQHLHAEYMHLVADLSVQCTIRVGSLTLSIAQLKQLKLGQNLLLQQKTNDPIELVVNNKIIAKGALMSHEDKFALQITELAL